MKATPYYRQIVAVKRPHLTDALCENVLARPARRDVQADGRVRYWGFVEELGKYLRVVTLRDGETVHNAVPDRSFRP